MTALSQGCDAKPPLSRREGCADSVWRWSNRSPVLTLMESIGNSTRIAMHAVGRVCKFTRRLLLRPSESWRSRSASQCAWKGNCKGDVVEVQTTSFSCYLCSICNSTALELHLVCFSLQSSFRSVNLLAMKCFSFLTRVKLPNAMLLSLWAFWSMHHFRFLDVFEMEACQNV